MWPDLIQKAKDGGLDVIQTYVFWNGHEPSPGQYYFEERYDLVKFIKLVQEAGLYVHLRIGPYVCAEWNFGGFPVWLKYIPGISFRTDNEQFKIAMKGFTVKIVDMMKELLLLDRLVYRVWWSCSSSTSGRLGVFSSQVYPERLTSLITKPEAVLHSLLTIIQKLLQMWPSEICITISPLGLSASFLIAELLSLTLQGLALKART